MSRPKGRLNGLSHEAVVAYLATNKATGAGIARATGLSSSAVWSVLVRLRYVNSPLLDNLIDGNAARRKQEAEDAPIVPADIVASALHARSPLEQAWAS